MPVSSDSSDPYRKPSAIAGPSATGTRPPPRPGDVVGDKYRIESVIGQGGMGAVFRARHLLTERAVALKWMLPEVGGEEAVQRFLREARAMGRIDHGGVVGVLDVGVDAGATFLVMELLKGNSLRDMLEARERFEPAEAIGLLMPALEGVDAAHKNGVVHRDLKPENIFVVRSGDGTIETTKVLDFGISKLRDDRLEQSPQVDLKRGGVVTRTGVTIGTPSYMSPEQVRGAKDIDARTDVWSLGVILYELLTGEVPFRAESFGALLVAIATESFPPLDAVRPELPPMLVGTVHRALAKDPSLRFPDVASFAASLEPFAPKGMRFRVPDVQRLTDVSIEPPDHARPPEPPKRSELAGTAVAKPRGGEPPRAAPPADLVIDGRSLDLPKPPAAVPVAHARTALAPSPSAHEAAPRNDAPSLPPLELDLAPAPAPRRPLREHPREPARESVARRPEPAPAPENEARRWLVVGVGILVAAVVIALAIRLAVGAMRESTQEDVLPSSPPITHPIASPVTGPPETSQLTPPPTIAPPPHGSSGSTTASGTSLSQPPPATSTLEAPHTPRERGRTTGGSSSSSSSGSSAPSSSSTSSAAGAGTAMVSSDQGTTMTETTGRTGALSREEF